MELKFDSIEEVKAFVAELKGEERPVSHILPMDFASELAKLARSDKKISAIKLYRSVYGSTLKEAKDALDFYWTQVDYPPRSMMESR